MPEGNLVTPAMPDSPATAPPSDHAGQLGLILKVPCARGKTERVGHIRRNLYRRADLQGEGWGQLTGPGCQTKI